MTKHDTHEAARLADLLSADPTESPVSFEAAAILRRVPGLEAEVQEQARLNGMGAERELALRAQVARLESELEAARLGEATHDRQATEYAQRVAHWIGKFDEVKEERDQLRAEREKVRWQPIDTATEEDEIGGQAWLLVDGVVVRGYFLSIPFQEYRDADGFYCGQQDANAYWARAEDGEPVSPTHFQRITPPAAPTPPNADQKGAA